MQNEVTGSIYHVFFSFICNFAGLAAVGGPQASETVLEVRLSASVSYDHVRRLFDIVPGLDSCNYDHATGTQTDCRVV